MTSPFHPDAVSAETRAFNAGLREQLSRLPTPMQVPVVLTRKARAEGRGLFPPAGPCPESRWQEIPGASGGPGRVRISLPPEGQAVRGTYLHIHGGGWTLGAPEQCDAPNLALAAAAGCRVVSVAYRLSPEHRWPGCLEDCMAAARWALATDPGPVAVGGESAGGHLAAAVLLGLKAEGLLGRMAGAVLTYGVFDLAMTPSMRAWGEDYLVLSTPVVRWFIDNLLDGRDPGDPLVSPLQGDLAGMPPALFQVGTLDPLLDDTLFMAARWQAAGALAETVVHPGGVHGFDAFDLAIARDCRERVARFLAARLAG